MVTLHDDTICAVSTPPGTGAIALIRVCGPQAITVSDKIISLKMNKPLSGQTANTIHFATVKYKDQLVDDVIVSLFRAPHSYTGDDMVEISCHGSVYVQQKILSLLIRNGARLAKPGEFTLRAFMNGKLDLSMAEGVADLIASSSAAAHRLAFQQMRGGFSEQIGLLRTELLKFISLIELELDFSEEDVEFADRKQLMELIGKIEELLRMLISSFEYGNAIKNGIPVAIVGPANVGKSTLLNQLLREEKAIVSEIAGTTRDYIEDTIILEGIEFRFIDTAGLRKTSDAIETEGIQRTVNKYKQASVVIVMIDPGESMKEISESLKLLGEEDEERKKKTTILVLNKIDLLKEEEKKEKLRAIRKNRGSYLTIIPISAKQGDGLKELEYILVKEALRGHSAAQEVVVTNVRHFEALKLAREALIRAKEGLETGLSADLLAQDIREVLHYLGEITGEITTDEILGNIFKNFCIGK
jgi:tRNA modification GTPase